MKNKTKLEIVCCWCGAPMGTKDGQGVEGKTGSICPKCLKKEKKKIEDEADLPSWWNPIGRFLARRRLKKDGSRNRQTAGEFADTLDEFREACQNNPTLHGIAIVRGQRFIHYLDAEDLLDMEAAVGDIPEFKCKWN